MVTAGVSDLHVSADAACCAGEGPERELLGLVQPTARSRAAAQETGLWRLPAVRPQQGPLREE